MHCSRRAARGCQQLAFTSTCPHLPRALAADRLAVGTPWKLSQGVQQPSAVLRPTAQPAARQRSQRFPRTHLTAASPAAMSTDTAREQLPPDTAGKQPTGVVIVGGGPTGLALALTLVQLHGHKDVTVLEQRQSFTFTAPDRSYVYLVDGRSRKVLDQLGLSAELDDVGVRTTSLIRAETDGKVKRMQIPVKDTTKVAHLMPRSVLLDLLERAARKQPAIRLLAGATCTAIRREAGEAGQQRLVVEVQQQQQGQEEQQEGPQQQQGQQEQQEGPQQGGVEAVMATAKLTLTPQLLVGCDGHRSAVRAALAAWEDEDSASSTASSSDASSSGRFQQTEVACPSAGLRYKVLVLPPNPKLRSGDVLENHMFAAIAGAVKPLRLGMQPVKDATANRTCNLITRPDHPVWDITEAEDMYAFFERCFPQMDARALVPHERMAAYAASRGGAFPVPAYSNGCMRVLAPAAGAGAAAAATGASGVLLLGDALHTFPPDLAQGVNAALEDVHVLSGALSEAGGDVAAALPLFEQWRMPDVRALVELMPHGHPYQYTQDAFKRRLWDIRFLLLMLLNKVAPWLFAPPVFMQIQDSSLSYSTILQRAKDTRTRLLLLMVALAAAVAAVLVRLLA